MYDRNRYLFSIMLAILVIFALGISISSYFPDNSEEYAELKNLLSPIDGYNTDIDSWESAKNALIDFNYWEELIPRFDEIGADDSDVQSLKENVKQKISKLQIRMLPKIRKYYSEKLEFELADKDYGVKIYSFGRNKIIGFTHKNFKYRKSIEQFHTQYLNELKILGFNEIRYKLVDNPDESKERYVKYNFEELNDNQLRKFTLIELEN